MMFSLLSKLIKTSAQVKFIQREPKDPALPAQTISIGLKRFPD